MAAPIPREPAHELFGNTAWKAATDNHGMRLSPRTLGLLAAVVTVTLWTGFIVIARAAALRTLTPLDIALLRISGAIQVLEETLADAPNAANAAE